MAITINTNISSLIAQRNFDSATNALNLSIERMTTGYKINHASDNAAGYSISNMWVTQLGSLDVASDNAATGADMLSTAEETYGLLTGHLQRVRDLTEQAANGTFGSASLRAIQAEILARLQEVDRIAANSEFNGIKLMAYKEGGPDVGITSDGINLQVGLYAENTSVINLDVRCFRNASVSGLFNDSTNTAMTGLSTILSTAHATGIDGVDDLNSEAGMEAFAAEIGLDGEQ
jgi:flagellin